MSADFSRAAAAIGQGLLEHADRDELRGVKRAVFMDRGGHAPGEACPSAPAPVERCPGCGAKMVNESQRGVPHLICTNCQWCATCDQIEDRW